VKRKKERSDGRNLRPENEGRGGTALEGGKGCVGSTPVAKVDEANALSCQKEGGGGGIRELANYRPSRARGGGGKTGHG